VTLPPWISGEAAQRGLASLIDHTLLRPEATAEDLLRHCDEAMALGVAVVCVNPQWVAVCTRRLGSSGVKVASVVGFPLGASGSVAKAVEARLAAADGARELDVVAPIGWIRSGLWSEVGDEFAMVTHAAGDRLVKVILETAVLTPQQIRRAATAACDAGVGMLKTSTGFHPAGGATCEAVRALREVAGAGVGVKASGGIRTVDEALAMIRAGADRIGTSAAATWTGALGPGAPSLADLLR
jgi:deoxyribose-phosphate aldolase